VQNVHYEDQFRKPNLAGPISLVQVTPFNEGMAHTFNFRPKGRCFGDATGRLRSADVCRKAVSPVPCSGSDVRLFLENRP
jgi:hypothetical protein